jgi:four helix bundle protein
MKLNSFRDLRVWQLSMQLVEIICRLTQNFPKYEMYGLASQIQRAAVSVPSNIAEGQHL